MPTPRQISGDDELISAEEMQAMREGRRTAARLPAGAAAEGPEAEQPAWVIHMERMIEK